MATPCDARCTPAAGLMAALALCACVPDVDDDLATIDEPRILAVRATPAEAELTKGPATVTLEALVARPDGSGESRVLYRSCRDRKPLTELGPVSEACLDPAAPPEVAPPLGSGVRADIVIPPEACGLFGPLLPPPEDGKPSGRAVDPDSTGGFYQPVIAVLGARDVSLGAVRLGCGLLNVGRAQNVAYNERYHPNRNPEIAELALVADGEATVVPVDDGASEAPVVRAGSALTLRASFAKCPRVEPAACTGAETYAWFEPKSREVRNRREAIVVSWFATGGEFDDRRTGVAESDPDVASVHGVWTPPAEAGEVKLWAVIRDDRGGVSWKAYRFDVQE